MAARAQGRSVRVAADMAECSERTVKRVSARHREWVEEQRQHYQRHVLKRLQKPIDARLADAADKGSRTGAQSLRVLAESILAWGGKGDMHVHGDVSICQVDARAINVEALSAEERARLERLRELMGG